MAKVFVPKKTCIFSITIFILLILSVGLLVFVLKGQIHHENTQTNSGHGHTKVSPVLPKGSTGTPSPQTAPKSLATRSTTGQTDTGLTTESPNVEINVWENFRLPKYIIPLHYDLLLHPNISNDTFNGSVNITVNVTRSTNFFVVHAYRLTIKESKVFQYRTEEEMDVKSSFLYDPHEYFVVETETTVEPDIYKLSFKFFGSLIGSIVGFYKSRYTDRHNQTRYLATSKFQPTYARRAFPCYDEPSFKSTFTVSLVHEPGYTALSNMPVDETNSYLDTELLVTKFQTSVPMVTYLACFIVCDFDHVRTTTSAGKEFRVYAAPDQINKTEYALKFGSRVLEYFENYFGIDYPLPKQDMVAIPDFVSGAMEHWGVITFRETNLLYDKESSSPQNKQRVSTVISHEMTHMWFGNLVTMEWWDDLWLNEGFASYVEYKGVHEQHPEWDLLSQFVTEEIQPVMDLDSTMSSHPIVQPVTHPDEITEIFDDISYGKGASVLRMLEFFVGKENFQKGISQFLKKYQFQNAKTADLWAELSESCGYQGNHTIASVMKTWTEQMGFPFITVRRLNSNRNETIFIAKQERFVKNDELYRQMWNSSKEYVWSVPLSYITEDGQRDIIWIHDDKEMEFTVPIQNTDWIKFNVNQTGYYLVNYEKEEWDKLIGVLMTNHELFSPADRSNLLFDTFLLAEAGHIPFEVFLSMSMYLKNETHLIPWETAYHSFVYLCQLMEHTEVNFLLKSYIKDLTDAMYNKLGWETANNHLDSLLRTTIIGLACHSGNKECLSDAAQLFQNWTQGQEIPSSLRSLVYHYGMSEIGQEDHWNYMWNKYLAEESPSERKTLLYGLAHVKVRELLHRYLEYAMDDQKIRRQDFFTVINYIAGNPVGRPLVWKFLRENWTKLVKKFTLNDRYLGLAVKKICSYFTADHELEQMKAFFSQYPDAGAGKRRRQQALENVQNNIKWLKTYKNSVKIWLEIEGTSPWYYHRLPTYIVPEHYNLMFHPILDGDTFTGATNITVSLNKPTDCFLVHVLNLNITSSEIRSLTDNNVVTVKETFLYDDNEYFVLKVGTKLPIGKYNLFFQFEGPFTVSLKGLYKSSYVDPETKETMYLATTQFEPTHARRAFPCFDEPTFKSTFSVSIVHESDHFALSNAAVKEIVKLDNGLSKTSFQNTFPMVTYLLALVVCDFKYKETMTDKGVKLRVYAAPHHIDKVDYALDVGSKILTYYETYFDVHFPLNKLDMIAIPDFRGGMENWGLITYSEKSLLCTNVSSVSVKHDAVGLIAHELAHMWFGDLVTMKWWDDLWLNEGFATFMGQKGVQHAEPMFDADNDVRSRFFCYAMEVDQTVNSHPIIQQVIKVKAGLFDGITYQKGSSVLVMLENYMGEDFRRGVSAYLKKYSFGSAKTEDLWAELTTASTEGLNVTHIMETWTKQMNYPYITISKENGEERKYVIKQHRFLKDPSTMVYSTDVSPFNYIWQIPITYRTSDGKEAHHLVMNSSDAMEFNLHDTKWFKFNANFTGYYSVNYDVRDWKEFIDILKNNYQEFSPPDRINLLFDSFSLASAGQLDYEIPLNMTAYLKHETYHGAWRTALESLEQIKRYFKNDRAVKDIIKEHIRSLCKNLWQKYHWMNNSTNFSEERLKSLLIDAACKNGHHQCLITAGNLFNDWKKGTQLKPNIRGLVYIYGLRVLNDDESWEFLWQKYLHTTDPDEKGELQKALTLVRNGTQIERFIAAARNVSFVRKHEFFRVLKAIAVNQRGFSLVTSLIYNNWTDLIKTYGSRETEGFAYSVFKLYDSEKDLKKVREFYRKNKIIKDGHRYRTLAIESILENIRWLEMHKAKVKEWFENNVFMPWKNIRLPRHVEPSRYNITMHPNVTHSSFEGTEEITITVSEPTDCLLIHELGLKIFSIDLVNLKTGERIAINETFPFKRNNFYVIRLENKISTGEYELKFNFSGTCTKDNGLGRYEYESRKNGSVTHIIASKFEPTDARRVFPCFDEPDKKARFKLTLIHKDTHTALSNMPVESETSLIGNLTQTVFEESVVMSPYLLSVVIGDLDYIETDYKGKPVRVYAPPDRIHEAEHGLNVTVHALEKYEEYFDVPYELPKLDSVVIPEYVVPAMEHWGAITYSEGTFLVGDGDSPYSQVPYQERVIAHEIAHQWFGNLVTMKWWNDLWLNEGFSTFIMYMPLQEAYPAADEFQVRKMSKMMCGDASMDSHSIRRNVSNPADISDLFDSISYQKGAAVLRMLEYALKDDFRKGLSNYLKKYAFKNAETEDLWEELTKASSMDVNITEMMNTWTLQMGFPYIELKRNGDMLEATQQWFLRQKNDTTVSLLAQDEKLSPFGFQWKIPLIYKNIATGNEHTLWLNDKNDTYHISAMQKDILKFNPEFVGYYIVKYDEHDYANIVTHLKENHEVFSVIDRYNLLHDAFMLAESGRLLYDVPLEFTKYMTKEKESMPWLLVRDKFRYFRKYLDRSTDTGVLFNKYVRYLTDDLYEEIVFSKNDTSHFEVGFSFRHGHCPFLFRDYDLVTTIADLACQAGNERCIETMNNELELWLQEKNTTVGLDVILSISIPNSRNDSLWEIIYDKVASTEDRRIILNNLGKFTGRKEILKTIEIMESPLLDSEMAKDLFDSLGSNPYAIPLLWNYVKANWELLIERFKAENDPSVIIAVFCNAFKTVRDLGDIVRFLKTVPPMTEYVIQGCMEHIQDSVNWAEKHERTIQNWLHWQMS